MHIDDNRPAQERIIEESAVHESVVKDKGEEIFDRIRANDDKFRKARLLFGPKKSIQECLQYLKKQGVPVNESYGVITGVKGVPNKVHRFRPQFKPDGSLLTIKRADNKVKITEIEVASGAKNADVKKSYQGLTDVFLKHVSITEGSGDASLELSNLRLDENEVNLAPVRQEGHGSHFDDLFIEKMLTSTRMPHVSFKKDPKDLFYFFDDVTTVLINGLQRTSSPALAEKLNTEFNAVCLLNALFGNPNIHLV